MRKTVKLALFVLVFVLGSCSTLVEDPFTGEQRNQAESVFNKSALSDSLEKILEWHETNQTGISDALNPGADRTSIKNAITGLDCQPTEELIQFWEWHNGTHSSSVPFIWYHDFLSVEDAISENQQLTSNPLVSWRKNWIPIFSFQGEWYFVECYEEIRKASPVGYLFVETQEPTYTYLSLTRMLETSAAYYDQGAVYWDSESWGLGDNIKEVFSIHQKLNSGAHFPYHVE